MFLRKEPICLLWAMGVDNWLERLTMSADMQYCPWILFLYHLTYTKLYRFFICSLFKISILNDNRNNNIGS